LIEDRVIKKKAIKKLLMEDFNTKTHIDMSALSLTERLFESPRCG